MSRRRETVRLWLLTCPECLITWNPEEDADVCTGFGHEQDWIGGFEVIAEGTDD